MSRPATGHITVTAGMTDAGAERRLSRFDRKRPRLELQALAHRLRARGWSYRRIASELSVSYQTVSQWLDGDAGRLGIAYAPGIIEDAVSLPVAVPSRSPRPTASSLPPSIQPDVPVSAATLEELVAENRLLRRRVDQLLNASEVQRRAMLDLEARLVSVMETQNRQLSDRILDGIKTLFSRFAKP